MIKRRFDEIDVMRIFGFLMVLDQHILGAYAKRPDTGFTDSMALHFLFLLGRPAVPMFIAITGFTLFYTNYNRMNVGEFYKKRLSTIVLPYLFWSFATIIVFRKYFLLKDILLVLATGSASYHLWYMAMSIRLYIWFPLLLALISWVLRRNRYVQWLAFLSFFGLYWLLLKNNTYLTDSLANMFFGTPSAYDKKLIQYSPVFWSVYFVCGAVVSLKYEYFKQLIKKFSGLIIAAYVPLTAYMYYTQVCGKLPQWMPRIAYNHLLYIFFMLGTAAVVYLASVKIVEKAEGWKKWLAELGALSYGAYLVHVMILQNVASVLRKYIHLESNLIYGIIIFAITAVLSYVLCYIIRLMPLSQYIIGVRRVSPKPVQAKADLT